MLKRPMAGASRSRAAAAAGLLALAATVAAAAPSAASAANGWANNAQGHANYTQGHAYRHGAVPSRAYVPMAFGSLSSTSHDLRYGGGVSGVGVTTGAPQVYLVFWGSQWGSQGTNASGNATFSGDPDGVAPDLQAFFKGIGTGGEQWSGVMTQYCQGVSAGTITCPTSSTQHVGYPTGGALAGVWEDTSAPAPAQASGHQIAAEAVSAATHFGNTSQTSNRNTQYVIVSPTGANPDGYVSAGFCAWHDYTGDTTLDGGGAVSSPDGLLAFTNLPYIPDAGASCGQNFVNGGSAGTLDGVTIVEGHEYAETITDQYPAGGWLDSSGEENGDKCAWISSGAGASQDISLTTGSFAVQSTWANDANSGSGGCEVSHPIVSNGGAANTVTVTNPGNQSGTVGTAASLQIQASDSASGQTLTYSATGLPAGLSINSATGLISGTPTTAATYSATVTVTDGTGASGSASFSWAVASSSGGGGTGCTAQQLLGNPGFETGTAAPWTASAGVIQAGTTSEPAHSGSYMAWLDGYNTATTDTLAQQVSIPSGCTSYTFSFWLHIDTYDTRRTSAKLQVQVLGSTGSVLATLASFTNLNRAAGYQQHSYSVSKYAGRTVTLKFTGTQSSSRPTSFVIDDTALNVS